MFLRWCESYTSKIISETGGGHWPGFLQMHLTSERGQNCFKLACKGIVEMFNISVDDGCCLKHLMMCWAGLASWSSQHSSYDEIDFLAASWAWRVSFLTLTWFLRTFSPFLRTSSGFNTIVCFEMVGERIYMVLMAHQHSENWGWDTNVPKLH